MTFEVKAANGRLDKRKTTALMKKLQKSCEKINKTVFEEVKSFQDMAKEANVNERFWRAAAHRAMLILHKNNMDVWLSAEFADLFGNTNLSEPTTINSWIDIERLDKAREKWEQKEAKKEKK